MSAQTAEPNKTLSADEAAKRLQFLKTIAPAPTATPQPTAATLLKKHFAETRGPQVRINDPSMAEPTPAPKTAVATASPSPTAAPKTARTAEAHVTEPKVKIPHAGDAPSPTPAAHSVASSTTTTHSPEKPSEAAHHAESGAGDKRVTDARPSEVKPASTPSPKSSEKTAGTVPHPTATPNEKRIAEAHASEVRTTPAPSSKSSEKAAEATHHTETPTSEKRIADTHSSAPHPAATPAPKPPEKPAEVVHPPAPVVEKRIAEIHATPTPAPAPAPTPRASTRAETVSAHYPWKTNIVTTVFWIGEPVGGHNFTPNCSSSWDANWTHNYGGYDNPNPEARRNFIPVNFTPRQNPFYIALPYNDVTRGTTKPEARLVIPWFREAFRKEGQSVCRDRWIAVRNREGRVAYAQWSDCGPFRTDHWQYVFGLERPRPNLNQGAGLDVSPAMRDYLGLQSTDITDWKFVDTREVPNGPWAVYGDNNPLCQRHVRTAKTNERSGRSGTEIALYPPHAP